MIDEKLLQTGLQVYRRYDPGRSGHYTGRSRSRSGISYYQIKFSNSVEYVPAYELEIFRKGPQNWEDLVEKGRFGRASDLRRYVSHIFLSGRLSSIVYSLDITNTEFYPHQFKPVFAFLESPSNGLLIADEVGLGKTIEAGLIWTELRARYDFRRVLVVCPAMLREKWRDELRNRFGVDATIMDAADLVAELQRSPDQTPDGKGIICSMQGIRLPSVRRQEQDQSAPRRKLANFLNEQSDNPPIIDLLIIDEAHHMRNRETQSARLGKMLRDISKNIILLSATPINLRSDDLFSLLNIVDPDTFHVPDFFPQVLQANEPLIRARRIILDENVEINDIHACLDEAAEHDFLQDSLQIRKIKLEFPDSASIATQYERVRLANMLERINLWRHVYTRTRKSEVLQWQVIRKAESNFIPQHYAEKELYDAVTEAIKSYAQQHGINDGFLLASPQRQVSSCMYAAAKSWSQKVSYETQNLYEDMLYEDMGAEIDTAQDISPFMEHLTSAVLPVVDLDKLRAHDSKFNHFLDVIEKYFLEYPNEKIVVFSYFRATLFYLEERLNEQDIPSQVLMGGMKDSKQDAIRRFRSDDSVKILLSSEVASEGVDLEFCRMIVNYDLPWNPMKVEQRIGRLDRIGQKSKTILIRSFGYANTIDQRIYERLFERLGIFERALGGMEAILGEKIKELTDYIISHR
ncbi:MAG: SNF2-related protein, partial [bacterium]